MVATTWIALILAAAAASPVRSVDVVCNDESDFACVWARDYANGAETLISRERGSISNFQPAMMLPADALATATGCPHLDLDLKLVDWDDATLQWPGRDAAGPPLADGTPIEIPNDMNLIIRRGMLSGTSSSPYGRITVPSGSRLIFDDPGANGDAIELDTLGVRIDGAVEAGSPTCRLQGRIQITLHGSYQNPDASDRTSLAEEAATDMFVKGIVVTSTPGARLDLHGKLYHPTWTRLAAHVPGSAQQETGAPDARNTVLFLQDCVDWPAGGEIIVTTSHAKDTRDYDFNERATVDSVQCVTAADGKAYGQVTLTSALKHYHHAGEREYQCEVGLLTRSILIRGNDKSEPTDTSPLECVPEKVGSSESAPSYNGFNSMPCRDTFLTGMGGHTIIVGQGEGRLRSVEFYRMGMTNVVGRYPVHFHHSTTGAVGEVSDCAVHHSFYRAVTVHNAFHLRVSRNVAFDITGHAYYLESGVEEFNRIEYNLAAHVHVIEGPVIMGAFDKERPQTDKIAVPADHTASGFYISNVHNYVVGNAASGGWAGMQFPILPEPIDPALRFSVPRVVPKDRPALHINGNSVHSSSWFSTNSGAVYAGGSLYFDECEDAVSSKVKAWAAKAQSKVATAADIKSCSEVGEAGICGLEGELGDEIRGLCCRTCAERGQIPDVSNTLYYNAGRVGTFRLTRDTKDDAGNEAWFRVENTTAWLVNVGATGWGRRSEYTGFEVHDFQRKAIFVLFEVLLDRVIMNCRTSNAPRVPDAGSGREEKLLNDGTKWSGFFTYDHLMKHILTNWRISNCGGEARGLAPWVDGGKEDTGLAALYTIPANGFGPEVQLISKGFEYDWDTLGGRDFLNQSIFFSGSGGQFYHSMQYMSNWEDADGSLTQRGERTVLGPSLAGSWWHLDYRPNTCETHPAWKLNQWTCNKQSRHLGSMFTMVMPVNAAGSGSLVLAELEAYNPPATSASDCTGTTNKYSAAKKQCIAVARATRQGSMTHFGLVGEEPSLSTCTPPQECGETTARSWDPDLTGPFNHADYGGWYLTWDEGTPVHLSVQRVQLDDGAVMVQAMGVPAGTTAADVRLYAESYTRTYDYTQASTLAEVREAPRGDKYWLDAATDTLYWRVIVGFVDKDLNFDFIDREANDILPFTRDGESITTTSTKNQFQLHIKFTGCEQAANGRFCAVKPVFNVPEMGCPEGEVMVAIDQCGPPCELDGSCKLPCEGECKEFYTKQPRRGRRKIFFP